MTLKVIGTGFGRTGTDSMRVALEILGFGPCHHMCALLADSEHAKLWGDVIAGAPPDWSLLLGGYSSCVDWPSAHYWPQLIEAFPQAKVILTWRSAESWWASFSRTILPRILAFEETEATPKSRELIGPKVFGDRPHDRDHCIAVYEANVAAVKARVPADRLLIHCLGDGWTPLCAHLGVPVPEEPYPASNSTRQFGKNFPVASE
jgi:hypothetical protein